MTSIHWTTESEGGVLTFRCSASAATEAALADSAREIMAALHHKVLGLHASAKWEVVRVEFWPDTGRMLMFPATRRHDQRVDVAMLDVRWPELQDAWNEYEELLEDDDEDDNDRESGVERLEARIIDAICAEMSRGPHRPPVEFYEYEELIRRGAAARGSPAAAPGRATRPAAGRATRP